MNIFEIATREKYRFPYKGLISVEDLWDLNAAQLDGIYKALNAQKRTTEEESLLEKRTMEDDALFVQIEIVKYIFAKKQEELEARKAKAANDEKRRRLRELIASKQDDALKEMPVEELQKMLAEMED